MEAIIQVEGLTKQYDGFTLDHVSFSVPKGCIMGLIGENGAGKSTTLNAMLGLIRPDEGKALIMGEEFAQSRDVRENVGVVFEGMGFHQTLTPREIGKISRAAYRQWDDALYAGYLRRFQLPEKKPVKEFSKGMRVKLSIAVALSHHPKLLVLDEATSGLDPIVRDDILDIFLEFVQDEEHAILISSHITTDLEKVADYITFIHEGKVLFSREKDELRYQWGVLRCSEAEYAALDKAEYLAARREDCQWSVLIPDQAACRRRHPDAVIDAATIDDILLIYVKGGRQA